jgi:Asp-tRNA(Asn)/Glu-tRNA(Gln) amidotransferase A subunit family amidase
MNQTATTEAVLGRLRANLAAAGIAADEGDLDGMLEKGLLRNPIAFEEMESGIAIDALPDYLWQRIPAAPDQKTAAPIERQTAPRQSGSARESPAYPAIGDVAERIRSREISPVELTKQALARMSERDPILNAFQLALPEQALAAARRAEEEIQGGTYRGPLHGIPVAVKDLLAMEGTATTAGSAILKGWVPNFDAAGVERLRQAGAVIVGKTQLSEFAYSPGSNNAHYGSTRNPWNLEHDTGGSSSGSTAAVADGIVFAALGSDTGGSIRIPASLCGIVGLKPTFGRVSLFGAVPLAWSLDHLGPLTRTVADAAVLLATLAGPDARDGRTATALPFAAGRDADVTGLRIGVLRDDGAGLSLGSPETLDAWKGGLAALERSGAELVEIDLPEMRDLRVVNGAIIALEAVAYHQAALRSRLADVGEFARQRLLASYAYAPNALVRAQQARGEIRRRFDAIFERIDLLSTPTMPGGAPLLGTPAPTIFTGPFNALGWPAISVPVGITSDRLPLGLQLAGRPWDDATVLRAAAAVEAAGPWPAGKP